MNRSPNKRLKATTFTMNLLAYLLRFAENSVTTSASLDLPSRVYSSHLYANVNGLFRVVKKLTYCDNSLNKTT